MDARSSTRPATPAELAKATLRRLAERRLEPTPENYARIWADESGASRAPSPPTPTPTAAGDSRSQGGAWIGLIERLGRNLDRGGRQWTVARRKDSLQRVIAGSRSDPERLLLRMQALMQAWEADRPDAEVVAADVAGGDAAEAMRAVPAREAEPAESPLPARWSRAGDALARTVRAALPESDAGARDFALRLGEVADRIADDGADETLLREVESLCGQVQHWFGHHHVVVSELGALCHELTAALTELAEDQSWVRGQCAGVQARLADGLSLRSLRAAGQMLAQARAHQGRVRAERNNARDALRELLGRMLSEVGELGNHAGVFELAVERHAEAVARADSVESLADVVQAMLDDSRQVRVAVQGAQQRMQEQQAKAQGLEQRVLALEAELRRASDEAATDALTQVANRRGLELAFETETARCLRSVGSDAALAVGLIDIDNFKKLNDRLGHGAGDQALKALASGVRDRLRPVDHIARFGGEEFVVLLPGTEIEPAQQALTRLQRSLSASLFLHEGEEVLVTFSAGVTRWREGESLETTLARADEALYEAKRTGKNRTCTA